MADGLPLIRGTYICFNESEDFWQVITCTENQAIANAQRAGWDCIITSDDVSPDTHWFDIPTRLVHPRLVMPIVKSTETIAADGVEEIVISGIPLGTSLRIPTGFWVTEDDDGIIEFSTTIAGHYKLETRHPEYLPMEIEFDAN